MEIPQLVEKQRHFFHSGATKSYAFRLEALKRLRKAIGDRTPEITAALWQDLRKSEFESYATEISMVLGELNEAIRHLKKWMRPQRRGTPLFLLPATSHIVKEPYGVALIVSPWNYPFQLTFSPLVGAIAAGNCVVLKPSTGAPATAEIMNKIITESYDEAYIALVHGTNELTTLLLKERFDYIFYTGGVFYGKEVMKAAAENLTPVTLELGGKSPCIVDKEANIAVAARRIVWGKCLNSGQTCVAPDYLMVHNSVKEALIEQLKKEIVRQFGEKVQSSPDYPRIVSDSRFARLVFLMQQGEILYGGEQDEAERFIAPTLLGNIDKESDLMKEEIFGPLLPIIGFDELDEVIDYVNSKEKPLALYYFSENLRDAHSVIARTTSGGACINDVVIHVANSNIPFSGVGYSGMGGYHGRYSFATFSHSRSVMCSSTKITVGVKFAPYRDKVKLLKRLF